MQSSSTTVPSGRKHLIPVQRAADPPAADPPAAAPPAPPAPAVARPRTGMRRFRTWMLTFPIDLTALLASLLLSAEHWKGTLFWTALALASFVAGGLYRERRHLSILDELPGLCGRLLASAAVVALIAAQRHDSVAYIGGFMQGVAISAGLVVLGRAVTGTAIVAARRRRWIEQTAIIVGGGPVAAELARLLRRYPRYGVRFAGSVDAGRLDELDAVIETTGCDVLIVADIAVPEADLQAAVRRPAATRCDLWVVPRLGDSHAHGGGPDHIGAVPVGRARRAALTGPRWLAKRAFDVVLAAVALVLLSPVLLLCAVATRIEGGPGIFFRQQRIGRYGRPFDVIKFRSMRPDDAAESGTNWSIAGDPRVGPVGRFMRRTSLDELPQLWNIMRGDMTIVGPRPERPFFVDRFSADHPDYAMRHRVPVGLTGLAQVSGLRGDTSIADRARFDNYYIENWSLWLDVKVVLRTVGEVLRGSGR